MAGLKRNIVSNTLERGWSLALGLLVIPFQVRILGVENYGLLGFIASLQGLFSLLDLGLGPTVVREVAADTDPGRPASRAVVRTLTTAYWVVAASIGVGMGLSARWLVREWLRVDGARVDEMVWAIELLAVSVALRWPTALYLGILAGVQRLDVSNLLKGLVSGLRLIGGVGVLLLTRSLTAYVVWLGLSAFAELVLYLAACRRLAPQLSLWPGFSAAAVRRIWRFSLGMNAISVLTIVFTQSDRLVIGRLLPLEALGYYSVAYNVVTGLSVIPGVVTTALFPTLTAEIAQGRSQALRQHYAAGTQLVMYLVSLPAALLAFYGHDAVRIVTSAAVADGASRPLAILAFGSLLAAAVSVPYTLSIAAGRTRLAVSVNLAAILFYLPMLYVMVQRFGIEGAAWAWAALNAYYLLTVLPWVHCRLVEVRTVPWGRRNIVPFVLLGLLWIGAARLLGRELVNHGGLWSLGTALVAGVAYGLTGFQCLGPELRWTARRQCRPVREGFLADEADR